MTKDILTPYTVVKHFKGDEYAVHGLAMHSETGEDLVVYSRLKDNTLWVRPKDSFMSKVDKEKYPDATQENRFEYVCPLLERMMKESDAI